MKEITVGDLFRILALDCAVSKKCIRLNEEIEIDSDSCLTYEAFKDYVVDIVQFTKNYPQDESIYDGYYDVNLKTRYVKEGDVT